MSRSVRVDRNAVCGSASRSAERIPGAAPAGSRARTNSVIWPGGDASNGRYRSSRGASSSPARRMSPTTPTISAVPSPSRMCRPTALSPGKKRCSMASLTITTGRPPGPSPASNTRPLLSGMSSARK